MLLPENHPRHSKRLYGYDELVADGMVHIAAILAGIIGITTLLTLLALRGGLAEAITVAVYAAGFFSMFGFSLAYNMTPPSPLKWLLRRFDHSSIYLMIAGTYTPLLYQLQSLDMGLGSRDCRLGRGNRGGRCQGRSSWPV